jgi:8-oxo-dGTP pyrophosphatase MutT (NUDIX family)
MRREESFGIIPLSHKDGRWEVFLIQHRGGRYWGFPKGHAETDETPFQAASRELKEETNLDCVRLLWDKPLNEQYWFQIEGKRVFKKVTYFIAEVSGTVELQKAEINDGIWVPFPDAIEKVTHAEGKAILAEVVKLLKISF